ncbi:protein artichoke-like [Culicoides brevitarsis]|uniref:protein artichoke-like n=1 Tax=Culicoides brevitarsis TaxID=469753 RepID=UPI00307CAC6F
MFHKLFIILYLSLLNQSVLGKTFKCTEKEEGICLFSHVFLGGPDNTFYANTDPEVVETIIFQESDLQILPNSIFKAFPYVETFVAINASINAFNYHAFEHATEMKTLNVSHNEIQSLVKSSFDGARKLEVINISNNEIRSIDQDTFASLKFLKCLDLSSNLLQSLPKKVFCHNSHLMHLELGHNRFHSIEPSIFFDNPNLHYLFLEGNRIKDLSLIFSVNSLYQIETQANGMKHLALSAMEFSYPMLKLNIIASNNELEGVAINNFHVQEVSLFNNSVKNINFLCDDAFLTLERLDLEQNEVKYINYDCLNRMTGLTELNLSENQITDFEPKRLNLLRNLQIFYTFGNKLPQMKAKEVVNAFPDIKVIDISSEKLHNKPIIVHTEYRNEPLMKKTAAAMNVASTKAATKILVSIFILLKMFY